MAKKNVLIAGLGRISKKHIEAILASDFFTIVGGVDPIEERRLEFKEFTGARTFEDARKALDELERIDLAVIANESGGHFHLAQKFVGRVPHMLVEKPLTLRSSSSRELIIACNEAGTTLNIVQQNRLNPPVQMLLDAVESGALGKIYSCNVQVLWNRESDYYRQANWRGTWSLDGGVMSNQANHHLDLLRLIMGEPKRARAFISNTRGLVETDDLATGVIQFESGGLAVFELTTAAKPENISSSISVVGENGVITVGGVALNKLLTWTLPDSGDLTSSSALKSSEEVDGVYGFGHSRLYKHIADNWNSLPTPVTDPETGFHNVQLVERLYESAVHDREVTFSENPKQIPLGEPGISS